jgi:DNA ligase (NAD+)
MNQYSVMDINQAKERISSLKKEIEYHRHLYHVLDKQEISDAALDSLKRSLVELENQFPSLITEDSPTQRVSGRALNKFKKTRHRVRQWSLGDAFSEVEIEDWDKRIKKIIFEKLGEKLTQISYSCELKIDGLHIVLDYKNGFLELGATRGDGLVGENVTGNIKTIEAIPLRLKYPETLIAEGEVFMKKDTFSALNTRREKTGESLFANPRNAAAGAIRQLDSEITKSRQLDFFAYDISWPEDNIPKTQIQELEKLKKLGFKVNQHFFKAKNIGEVIVLWKEWKNKKESQNYWLDGLVVKVNDRRLQKVLGFTGKAPRWALALKYPGEEATTIVENIFLNLGRTGKITPVAKLRPVNIAGSVVARASLHNLDEINRLDIRIGDTVIIHKAGDIIPQIKSVIKNLRSQNSAKFTFPLECPNCESEIIKPRGEVNHYCSNKNCGMLERRRLYYFVSKKALNIDGLGPKIIDQLMDVGLVKNASDIFKLKKKDLLGLDRFGEKSVNNLIKSIENKKEIPLVNFLIALGISHVGEEIAGLIVQEIENIDDQINSPVDLIRIFSHLDIDKLGEVGGIGPKIAGSVDEYFKNEKNKKLLEEISGTGVSFSEIEIHNNRELLLGKQVFVLTGSLESVSREEAKKKIKLLGGRVADSISSKTNFVVVGENPGSKLDKAKNLGIKVIDENKFLELIREKND